MKPSAQKALNALRAGHGWISGNELAEAVGWRYSARLYELRAMGYVIERRSVRGRPVDDYRIVEKPEQLSIAL